MQFEFSAADLIPLAGEKIQMRVAVAGTSTTHVATATFLGTEA